jgi:hypothetical protein
VTLRLDPLGASRVACVGAIVTSLAGCTPGPLAPPRAGGGAGAPMNKPVMLNSDPSSGSVESARRALFGTWQLAALEVVPPGGGARVPVQASGTLIYDEFGNLTIDAQTTDPAAPVAAREKTLLSFKGRAVIDVVKHELKLMNLTGNVDPDEVLSPERRRRYDLDADTLKLSSIDEREQVTAVSTWRRRQ